MILGIALLLAAQGPIYVDGQGVMRWRQNRQEVVLYGANYVITTASDYRAAGYVGADRKRAIDDDMAHFARMGWDGIRLTFWGDWEAADSAGNLLQNEHLDLLDYLIARARERGISMLFSPIQLYSSNWPDAMDRDGVTPGFGRVFGKGRMGTDPAAIASQVNYLKQILNHVNPYTGVAIKNEPNILFIELVNEPWHHPEDLAGSIRYINALTDAVRSTGCDKLIFYNVSQDFRIGEAIRRSKAQGVTFGWYPTGLNSGRELRGNYLRTVDAFPDMLRPEIAKLPRIVYEFDTPDLRTGYLYPAMARTFRAVGAQFAAMFTYDMLPTASRNLGWQTHYLSLAYTPRKAMSSVIAAEVMRRLPRMRDYGPYPASTRFGDFRVSYEQNSSELVARDAFLYAGSTVSSPPEPGALRRVAGVGSSPVVAYDGTGAYFLDKVRAGVWRLEVYPDADELRDPFEAPSVDKIVTRAVARTRPMTITLPDLGAAFAVQPLTAGGTGVESAVAGRLTVAPGVYVLAARGPVDRASLPDSIGHLAFAEYRGPPLDSAAATSGPPVSPRGLPGRLFDPGADFPLLAFTRIGDAGRRGLFRIDTSRVTGRPVFHFALPVTESGWSPADYTASLVITDRRAAADSLRIRLRGLGPRQTLHVTLMEDDGTSWSIPVVVDSTWTERSVALSDFTSSRGVLLPQGFPGEWSYWVGPAAGRGGAGDRIRLSHVERLQLSLRRDEGPGVEVESVTLGVPCCTATFLVRVPEGTGTVYLAGSLPELGPWRPDGKALTGTGRGRTTTVTAPPGTSLEYKFTLGSWDREALTATGTVPGNSRLLMARDTQVMLDIPAFRGGGEDYIADWRGSGVEGQLVYWRDVASTFLGPKRNVVIWLPPGYDSAKATRYPVLYMHDGQNLFDPRLAFTGVDWGVDEAVNRLVRRGVIPPIIVVGVWNSAERNIEYSPWHGAPRYARFLIEELMPRINREFRTQTGPRNTAVMGSSMGGLLSFYLVTHHPEAFGACGCLSTHVPLSEAVVARAFSGVPTSAAPDTVPYVERDIAAGLTAPRGARYWFDFGSLGLDSAYAPTHAALRAWLLRQGLVEGRDFVVRRYEGATHNEASWRARLEDSLAFLFGGRRGARR